MPNDSATLQHRPILVKTYIAQATRAGNFFAGVAAVTEYYIARGHSNRGRFRLLSGCLTCCAGSKTGGRARMYLQHPTQGIARGTLTPNWSVSTRRGVGRTRELDFRTKTTVFTT